MKKNLICVAAIAAILCSCNKDNLNIEVFGEGIYASIEQPAFPSQTKSLSWNGENNSLTFTWADKENVVVFGESDAALLRSKTSGNTSTELESKGFDLKEGVKYYAFIPSSTFLIDSEAKKVPISFLGQRQVSNNSTAHLKDFDYACAEATRTDGTNSLSFELKNQVSWLVIEHLFTEATDNVTSLKISVPEKKLVVSGKYDVTKSEYWIATKSTELTLSLGKDGGDGLSFISGELFRAFLTLSPVDLSGTAITVTAYKKDGSAIELGTYTYPNADFVKNKPMIIKTSGTADVKPVASVGGREISSLQSAIEEAIKEGTTTSSTITLLDDVKGSFVINDLRRNFRGDLISTIIELNGHSIISDSKDDATITVESGELLLKNGGIKSDNSVAVKFAPTTTNARIYLTNCNVDGREGAVCTSTAVNSAISINGGTFSASDNAVIAGNGNNREGKNRITLNDYNGKVPVINGKIESAGYVACGIYAPWEDVITVNAAEFNIENGVGILSRGGHIDINNATIVTTGGDKVGKVGDSRIVVPCKTVFIDSECNYPALANAAIVIKGGKFSDDACAEYLFDNTFGVKRNGTVYEVISNGDILSDAVNSVEEKGVVSVDYNVSLKSDALIIKKDCEISLAKDIVVTAGFDASFVLNYCKDGGNNILSGDGTVAAVAAPKTISNSAVWVNAENQTLTINDEVSVVGGSAEQLASAIEIYNGKLVINGGHFTSGTDSKGNNSPAIYLYPAYSNKAVLEINGGVFESVSGNAQFLINCHDEYMSNCKISITGGTFVGWNPAESYADIIDGKPANWVPDGYVSTETTYNGKQAWTVSKK